MLQPEDSATDAGSPENTEVDSAENTYETESPPLTESATSPSVLQEGLVDENTPDTSQAEWQPMSESADTPRILEEVFVDGSNPDTSQTESLLPTESATTHSTQDETLVDGSNLDTSQTELLPPLKLRKSFRRKRGVLGFAKRVLLSDPEKYRLLKACFSFPLGALIAVGLYYLVIVPLEFRKSTTHFLGVCLGVAISFGFAFSVQIRCIVLLVLPTFFSRAGRSYVLAFAIVYLVSGPIANIVVNCREVSRALSCMTSLLANHTMAMWKLRISPLKEAVKGLQAEGFMVNKIGGAVESAFAPIRQELEDDSEVEEMEESVKKAEEIVKKSAEKGAPPNPFTVDDTKKKHAVKEKDSSGKQVEEEWERKLDVRCEEVFAQGIVKCRDKFASLEQKCMDALWLLGYVLCLPLKMTFFCELVRVIPGAFGLSCNSLDVVDPGLGETYVSSRKMINEVSRGMKVRMQFKVSDLKASLHTMTVEEIRKGAMNEYETKAAWVQFFMTLIQRLLGFTFLLVFREAISYHKYFLTQYQYDNIYITHYFRRIDARRKAAGKKTLLPLKKTERQNLIFPTALRLVKKEKASFNSEATTLVFRVILSGIVIYVDYLLVFVLDTVAKHSKIEYYQQGKAQLEIKVQGKGFMSEIVRMFLTAFNSETKLERISTNLACLPQAVYPNLRKNILIGVIYIGVFFITLIEAYGLRVRRVTAGFFYRKREKKRVLFLYNEMLKKRKGYLKLMRRRVRKQVRERELQQTIGVMGGLVLSFPRLCYCLRFLSVSKDSCLICKEPERKDFVRCPTPRCKWGYCTECWQDVRHRCYVCHERPEGDNDYGDDSASDSSSDSSDDSKDEENYLRW